MDELYRVVLSCSLALLLGFSFGWVQAHATVSTECARLGSFYVGDKTFDCKEKQK